MKYILNLLNNKLLTIWESESKIPCLFLLLEKLYQFLFNLKKEKQSINQLKINTKVVVVGNLTVGGTGKTPLVIYLAKLFLNKGLKVAILSKGYKSQFNKQFTVSLMKDFHNAFEVGDEPKLIFNELLGLGTYQIIIANKRKEGLAFLSDKDFDIIICDDGLQDFSIHKDLELVVIDSSRLLGNKHLLPAGFNRSKIADVSEKAIFVYNGQVDNFLSSHLSFISSIKPLCFVNLKTKIKYDLSFFAGKSVQAVCAIGNPKRFFKLLNSLQIQTQETVFIDHFQFKETDFTFANNETIIMTAKDAVKCEEFAQINMFYLSIEATLSDDFDKVILDSVK